MRSKNYQEAIVNFRRSIDLDSDYVWGHYNLALAYWAQKQPDQAVKEVEAVLKIDPSFRAVIKGDGQFGKFKASPEFVKLIESSGPPQ